MRVPLVLAADEAFTVPLAVTVASAVRSADDLDDVEIHVLGHGIDVAGRDLVTRAADGAATIEWHGIRGEQFADLPTGHLSPAAYYRLLIPELIDVDRAIYLDSDILVRSSLRPLVELPLGECPAAAARNLTVPFLASPRGLTGWQEIGLAPDAPYFNSGVLVMDLERWRERAVSERALEYARRFEDGISFADQDALNAALSAEWRELDPIWNQQPLIFDDRSGAYVVLSPDQVRAGRESPAVVHFVGPDKPWLEGCQRPWVDEWRTVATALVPGWMPERRRSRRAEAAWRARRAAHILLRGR